MARVRRCARASFHWTVMVDRAIMRRCPTWLSFSAVARSPPSLLFSGSAKSRSVGSTKPGALWPHALRVSFHVSAGEAFIHETSRRRVIGSTLSPSYASALTMVWNTRSTLPPLRGGPAAPLKLLTIHECHLPRASPRAEATPVAPSSCCYAHSPSRWERSSEADVAPSRTCSSNRSKPRTPLRGASRFTRRQKLRCRRMSPTVRSLRCRSVASRPTSSRSCAPRRWRRVFDADPWKQP